MMLKKERSFFVNKTYPNDKMYILPQYYQEHLKKELKRTHYLILSILVSLLQSYQWVRLEELSNKFPQNILFESRRRKLQRLLDLPQLTVEQIWFPWFSYWLAHNFEFNEVLFIAIDRTQWGGVNLLMISLIYQKRARPIYFELLPNKGCTNLQRQQAALLKVLSLLKNYTKVILGDREFCSVDLARISSNT